MDQGPFAETARHRGQLSGQEGGKTVTRVETERGSTGGGTSKSELKNGEVNHGGGHRGVRRILGWGRGGKALHMELEGRNIKPSRRGKVPGKKDASEVRKENEASECGRFYP